MKNETLSNSELIRVAEKLNLNVDIDDARREFTRLIREDIIVPEHQIDGEDLGTARNKAYRELAADEKLLALALANVAALKSAPTNAGTVDPTNGDRRLDRAGSGGRVIRSDEFRQTDEEKD